MSSGMKLQDERRDELLAARHRRSGKQNGPENIRHLHGLMYENNTPEEEYFNLLDDDGSTSSRIDEDPQFKGRLCQKKSPQYGWMKGRVLRQYVRKSGKGRRIIHCQILYEDGNQEDVSVRAIKRRQAHSTFAFIPDPTASLNQSTSAPVIKYEVHRRFPDKPVHFVHKPTARKKAWRSSASPLQKLKPESISRSPNLNTQELSVHKTQKVHKAAAHRAGFVNKGLYMGRRSMKSQPDKLSNQGTHGRPWREEHALPRPVHWSGSAISTDLVINEHGQVRHTNAKFAEGQNQKSTMGEPPETPLHSDYYKDAAPPSLLAKRTPANCSVNRTSVRVSEAVARSSRTLHHSINGDSGGSTAGWGYRCKYPLYPLIDVDIDMELQKEKAKKKEKEEVRIMAQPQAASLPLALMDKYTSSHREKCEAATLPASAWG